MENFIVIAVVAIIIGFAVYYIIRAKRKGQKCIGCPNSCNNCKNGGCCSDYKD